MTAFTDTYLKAIHHTRPRLKLFITGTPSDRAYSIASAVNI
jgi:hypothetical protein